MNAKDVKIDLEEFKEFKRKNAEERLWFIDFWVNYIKTHSDEEWSKGHKVLINSQIQGARDFANKARERRKVRVDSERVVRNVG